MTMHSVFSKEHKGIVQNPIAISPSTVPWWSGLPVQNGSGVDNLGNLMVMEKPASGDDQVVGDKQVERAVTKGNTAQFTTVPGEYKSSASVQKLTSVQPTNAEYRGPFEFGFGQPLICAKYPYGEQCYRLYTTYGPQVGGRIMLPLNLTSDDGPIFVNPKQYHGIIRRRKSRAKLEMENKVPNPRKPYLHLSRHLHAMRRPRGCGGRFLNTRTSNKDSGGTRKTAEGHICQPTGSQVSEVLQSDSRNLNSPEETTGGRSSHNYGSEVTSMFSREYLDPFPNDRLRSSLLTLPDMMNAGHSIVVGSKWAVAAADNCCNLKV